MRAKMTLPTDSTARKGFPLVRGFLRYFPAAIAGAAAVSKAGNDKHNPGEPMHHARGKSNDHSDCIVRHLMDVEDLLAEMERTPVEAGSAPDEAQQTAVLFEASQLLWRAAALSQELHERFGAPLAPGAKLPAPARESVTLGRVVVHVDVDAAITGLRKEMRRSRGNKRARR